MCDRKCPCRVLFVLKPNPKADRNVLYYQPIKSMEIEPIRLQEMNQPEEGDFFYVHIPTIYIVRESSLAFWIFQQTMTMFTCSNSTKSSNVTLLKSAGVMSCCCRYCLKYVSAVASKAWTSGVPRCTARHRKKHRLSV